MRIKVDGLQPNQQYAVQLRSRYGEAVSDWSRTFILDIPADDTIPEEPTGFTLVNNETTSFFMEWDAVTTNTDGSPVEDFSHYQLNIYNNDETKSMLVKSKENVYTLTLEKNKDMFGTAGVPDKTIKAKVRCVDIHGNFSTFTSLLSVTNEDPDAAEDLDAQGIPDAIRVQWDAPTLTQDFKEYTVHHHLDDGDFSPSPDNLIWRGNATSMIYQAVLYERDHYFKVVVRDWFGNTALTPGSTHARPIHAADSGDGGPPSGPAGGDLNGSYPNPTIDNDAVTTAKIADDAVTNDQIANDAVDTAQIADDAVTTAQIADNAVTLAQMANDSVDASNIVDGSITDAEVNSANKDGTSSTPSLRTLGTGGTQAAAGNDSRLFDAREGKGTPFQPIHAYKAYQFITDDDILYYANVDFTSGASFNSSDWTVVAGGGGGGGTFTGGVDIDCGGPTASGVDIDCGGP